MVRKVSVRSAFYSFDFFPVFVVKAAKFTLLFPGVCTILSNVSKRLWVVVSE